MPTNDRRSLSPTQARSHHQTNDSTILKLPVELLLALFYYLDYRGLLALSTSCRFLDQIMKERGWRDFCRVSHRHTASVDAHWSTLSWKERARDAEWINNAWSSRKFTARILNYGWPQKFHPVMALSSSRLIVAAGNAITSYRFGYNATNRCSYVDQEGVYTIFPQSPTASFDITGIEFLPDGGKDETLLISNHSGRLVRIRIPGPSEPAMRDSAYANHNGRLRRRPLPPLQAKLTAQYTIPPQSLRVLKVAGTIAVALGSNGVASVLNTASPWLPPSTSVVGKKAWSAHIESSSSSPYVAIGTDEHVVIHSFTDGALSAEPCARLGGPGRPTPVYCVGAFLPGGNPNIIASGWYDGKVRVHDLRSSQRTWISDTPSMSFDKQSVLSAVMTFSDPWRSFDPIYSLAARGRMHDENEKADIGGLPHQYHYLTAGSALHSVVCLWDARKPSRSWSVYAPGGDRSPVYSLKAEGSRVWGATQWRAFVLDFAPDAGRTSFPLGHDTVAVNGPPTYVHFSKSSST